MSPALISMMRGSTTAARHHRHPDRSCRTHGLLQLLNRTGLYHCQRQLALVVDIHRVEHAVGVAGEHIGLTDDRSEIAKQLAGRHEELLDL
jgi:hypothetical protein